MNNKSNPMDPDSRHGGLPAPLPVAHVLRRPIPPTARSTPASTGQGLTPAFVWQVFSNWWKLVLPLGILLSIGAGAAVWVFYVPKYQASALMKIEAETPFIAFERGSFNRDSERYVQTQIELLRGPVVLSPVLGRPENASVPEIKEAIDPLKYLQKQLGVRQIGKSELYEVSYVSPSPQDAASVANVVVAEYLSLQSREELNRSQVVIKVLAKEKENREANVERLRKRVVELSRSLTGKDPFGQGAVIDQSAFSPAAGLSQSLTESEVDYEVLKAELQGLQSGPMLAENNEMSSGMLELEISNRTDVRRLEERIGVIRQQMTEFKSLPQLKKGETWEEDPRYIQLADDLQQTEKDLKQLKSLVKTELIELRRVQRKAEQKSAVAAKQTEINLLSKKRELLAEKLKVQMNELQAGGAESAELEFAKAELSREQSVFELIAARELALQTEQRAPARVSLMQSAAIPQVAIEPIPYKYLLIACALSLSFPLGLAVGYEILAKRISSSEQLTNESSLRVVGEVARFPRQYRTSQPLPSLGSSQQRELFVFTESIDSLRTQLMLTEQLGAIGQRKIVAICSACSGEGKSSLATSLAMSLAGATKRPTLIIDADLRAPDVAQLLGVPSKPGIAELLTGRASLDQAIHRVGQTHAYVLPAGRLKGNPHHIFEGSRIDDLLETLRNSFDTILIDTPPVLAASDSLIYAKAADLVLFCSLADTSRAKQVRYAVERLQATGANIAGAVLSGVSANSYVYNYGTYGRHE